MVKDRLADLRKVRSSRGHWVPFDCDVIRCVPRLRTALRSANGGQLPRDEHRNENQPK